MPYFMRIVGGVGMHAGYLPGYPASHGCIRMPEFMAENFFKSVSTGTPVTITKLARAVLHPGLQLSRSSAFSSPCLPIYDHRYATSRH